MSAAARPLTGRHALVTGAGSGIGAAIATTLAAAGASLSLAGRRRGPLEQVAGTIGAAQAQVLDGFDVTDPTAIERGLTTARDRFGPVTILVNNAGEAPSAPFDKTDAELWSRVIAVDLTSVFLVTRAALGDLKAHGQGARVVNIASTAGLSGYAYVSAYCAAKHGVIGLTRSLALELAKTGITVNAVCPSYVETDMTKDTLANIVAKTGKSEAEARAELAKANPQGRLIAPEEVANAVCWLALPGSHSLTGLAVPIAGGEVM
jgi:NAD(P)-dependent dehydrogenase (short-subunit alcohol dehydrogenase family)